jgi:hypothetical protein
MYDKYFIANQFSLNSSKLPKHKGLLFTGGTAGTSGTATLHLVTSLGNTTSASILVNSSPFILPIQAYAVTTLPTGITAWYLN